MAPGRPRRRSRKFGARSGYRACWPRQPRHGARSGPRARVAPTKAEPLGPNLLPPPPSAPTTLAARSRSTTPRGARPWTRWAGVHCTVRREYAHFRPASSRASRGTSSRSAPAAVPCHYPVLCVGGALSWRCFWAWRAASGRFTRGGRQDWTQKDYSCAVRARVAVLPVVNRVILSLVLAVERGEVSAVMYPVLLAVIRTHPPNISKFQYVLRLKVWEYNAGSAAGPHHRRTIGSATEFESFAGIFREAHAHSSESWAHGVGSEP